MVGTKFEVIHKNITTINVEEGIIENILFLNIFLIKTKWKLLTKENSISLFKFFKEI